MRFILSIFFIFLFSSSFFAQETIKANSRGWSGGVCCRSGVNYHITIQHPEFIQSIKVRSAFLKNEGKLTDAGVYISDSSSNTFIVQFSTFRNHEINPNLYDGVKQKGKKKEKVPNYKGKALLNLEINGKKTVIEIDEFEPLPYLAHP